MAIALSLHRPLYEHGYPFTESFNTDVLSPITSKPRGVGCLVIAGPPGSGKTTFAVQCCDTVEGRPIKLDPNNHPQLAMGGEDLTDKAIICYKAGYRSIIYDEAGDLSRSGALTKFNRNMIQFFNKCRALGINIFICLPDFMDLDKRLFAIGIVDGLVHCRDTDQKDCTGFGVYDREGMSWLRFRASQWPYHPHKPYSLVQPYMRGNFLRLSSEREAALHLLSTGQKIESITATNKQTRRRKKHGTDE